jgi:hypothetical protein
MHEFTCGYCLEKLECPTEGKEGARQFAQDNGWRMTYGHTIRRDGYFHITCPECCKDAGDEYIEPIT